MGREYDAPKRPTKEIIQVGLRLFKDAYDVSKLEVIAVVVTSLLNAILPFVSMWFSTRILDQVISLIAGGTPAEIPREMLTLILVFIILELGIELIFALDNYTQSLASQKLTERFSLRFLDKASDLDISHYEDARKNDLIERANRGYHYKPASTVFRVIRMIQNIIRLVTSIGIVIAVSPLFALIIFIAIIPTLFVSTKMSDYAYNIWDANTATRKKFGTASYYLSDEKSLMELRIFKTRDYLFNFVSRLFKNFYRKENKAQRKKSLAESLSVLFSRMGTLSFWVYLLTRVLEGGMSIGDYTFYASASRRFALAIGNIFANLTYTYNDLRYIADYYEFIDLKKEIVPGKKKLDTGKKPPKIEYVNVDFTYPDADKPVLTNFNLTIEPGDRIAFVGENGAGKTTIIKLLSRFYDVTGGEILIDGINLKELNLSDWYGKMGILFQNFVTYGFLPAKKNISVGDVVRLHDEKAAVEAAKKSGADEFITELKKGYNQILNKRFKGGTDLSWGQWQRVALARAFFRDSPVLILDEPTSSIDAKGEFAIFKKLYEFTKGKTVIIISHRFSTVRMADKIYVIDKGKVVEAGSHEELIKKGGRYKKAFEKQAAGYK